MIKLPYQLSLNFYNIIRFDKKPLLDLIRSLIMIIYQILPITDSHHQKENRKKIIRFLYSYKEYPFQQVSFPDPE
jgi:hypothetical protein